MMNTIKRIGVLTSGGDAPGMNAAIRATVRASIYHGLRVYGIYRGYQGLIDNHIEEMQSSSVSNIIHSGGTILKSARCDEFLNKAGRSKARDNLREHGIDALVVIGGDGTFRGARVFGQEFNIPVVGIPGTIDNDLYGTDNTIGYDTALNTIVDAVDKIRDTATAHNRLFFIEVMGRDAGFLALSGGIASGAEVVLVPEIEDDYKQLHDFLKSGYKKGKTSSIVLVSEGDEIGGAVKIAENTGKEYPEYDVRVTILGHLQRGGAPSAFDRVLASRMGVFAVKALIDKKKDIMVGLHNDRIAYIPISQSLDNKKPLNTQLLELMKILSI